ncbi:head GIN domain-containing protein [Sphingomonas oligophenolica]|uniref:Head GIN domain-containing protein n=1 Tax=Sphingomonas oligophenolica TaxID=301154 RepID=A0ABU9Y2T4_9SPHN
MIRYLPLFAIVLAPGSAQAADRTYSIGSFDRIRVEGPFDVRLAIGPSPGARAEGDPHATDDLDIRVEGTTLIVRAGVGGWGEQAATGAIAAPVVTVSIATIRSALVIGGGRLSIDGPVRGQRIDLSLTGSGSLSVGGLEADQLFVTLLGAGDIALAGHAAKAHLTTSGPGRIAAAPLVADDLTLRLDGNGETRVTARYTATVTTTGLGAATVYGTPACTVKAMAGGPISCGKLPAP